MGVCPTSPHVLCGLTFFSFLFCQFTVEPASRNQRVVGGKGMKRKRSKKEVVKAPRKKRKGMLKSSAHQEKQNKKHGLYFLFHCFTLTLFSGQRSEKAQRGSRRGRPQGSEDDDQTESLLVRSGGLTDDALPGGLTPPQQQGTHTHTCSFASLVYDIMSRTHLVNTALYWPNRIILSVTSSAEMPFLRNVNIHSLLCCALVSC